MKLSKLFHSLYAILMFLPVMVIPIFAININQKSVEPIQVEVQENKKVTLYNKIQNGNFEGTNDWGALYCTLTQNDNNGLVVCNNVSSSFFGIYKGLDENTYQVGHKYIIRFLFETHLTSGTLYGSCFGTTSLNYIDNINGDKWVTAEFVPTQSNNQNVTIYLRNNQVIGNEFTISNVIFIDTTLTFGEGNEPTIEQFNNYLVNDFYEYGNTNILIKNYQTITYNDTDIGSQFLYSLYIPVKEYFNFGNFFGLSGMYDWFALNIFTGTAPLSFFIVFNMMIYWLFISLFWLIFDILIYVPMVIHKWLDKAEM